MRLPVIFLAIVIVSALAACSGGSSATTDTPIPTSDPYQRGVEDGYQGGYTDGTNRGWDFGAITAARCYDDSLNPGGTDCGMLQCVLPFLWEKPRPLKIGGQPVTECDYGIDTPQKDKCARANWRDYPDCKTPAPTVNRQ